MLAHLTVAMFTLTLIPVHVEFESVLLYSVHNVTLPDVHIKNIQCIKTILVRQELRLYFTLNTQFLPYHFFFIYKAQHTHKVKLH